MTPNLSRRRFLQLGAGAVGAGLTVSGVDAEDTPPAATPELTAYQDGPQLWVRLGGRVLTSYRAHPTQKYPYFYPLAGPLSGLSVTAETSLPWPHHRSLFFGCDRVNGGNYWQGPFELGQIVSTGLRLGKSTAQSVEILDQCEWRQPGRSPVLVDERRFTVTAAAPRQWYIDAHIKLTARQAVQVAKTNHSFFAVRAADDLAPTGGGILVNAEGKSGEKGTYGVESTWCDFSGSRRGLGNNLVEGVALMDHPNNPWSTCKWFTRDYGFMSPTPFNWLDDSGWRLPVDQSVTLRYRVVVHAGNARDASLAGVYKTWSAVPR